jgi:hypothetical protein
MSVNANLVFSIFVAAFGPAFQHGYNTGVLNEIEGVAKEWIRGCKHDGNSTSLGSGDCIYSNVEVRNSKSTCLLATAFVLWEWEAVFSL